MPLIFVYLIIRLKAELFHLTSINSLYDRRSGILEEFDEVIVLPNKDVLSCDGFAIADAHFFIDKAEGFVEVMHKEGGEGHKVDGRFETGVFEGVRFKRHETFEVAFDEF